MFQNAQDNNHGYSYAKIITFNLKIELKSQNVLHRADLLSRVVDGDSLTKKEHAEESGDP